MWAMWTLPFSERKTLKSHERIHTGKRPYRCDQCGQHFTQMAHLKTHQQIHTGEKPYGCDQCGKHFSEMSSLKKHQAVHKRMPFGCNTCGKRFSDMNSLKWHQRIHTLRWVLKAFSHSKIFRCSHWFHCGSCELLTKSINRDRLVSYPLERFINQSMFFSSFI